MADQPGYPGAPRWVKVLGIIVIVLVLLIFILMLLPGDHGPGRHLPSGGSGSLTPPIEHGVQQP